MVKFFQLFYNILYKAINIHKLQLISHVILFAVRENPKQGMFIYKVSKNVIQIVSLQ